MKERTRFVVEYESGSWTMAALCRQFGISRQTGYKWVERFEESGPPGLSDLSRAPHSHPNAVASDVEAAIVAARAAHPTWGPKKLLAWLKVRHPDGLWPSASTMGEILNRRGLCVPRRKRRRAPAYTEPFASCDGPNAVWCVDFKGNFNTGDGTRCDPLTLSDAFSRYVLRCQALAETGGAAVRPVLEAAFRQYGLPFSMRSDNGSPFASRGVGGLSRLGVWLLRLGIISERIEAGHPEQNGRHERMHRTLKAETASPPARTLRGQQRAFDAWRECFNGERPHEALGNRTPASVYEPSPRMYPERVPEVEYPSGLVVRVVQKRGEFYWRGNRVFLGEAFSHEPVGLEPLDGRHWGVYYTSVELCVFDSHSNRILTSREAARLASAEPSLSVAKVSTMCPV